MGRLRDPEAEFRSLVEFAGSTFSPESWWLAFANDALVGMVLSQRYHDLPLEGTLLTIGVVPEHRRRGYGRILHAKGLETLADQGVERYVGSTHVDNLPMLRVFVANDCGFTSIRDQAILDYY